MLCADSLWLTYVECRGRIFQYYLPVFFWCQKQLAAHKVSPAGKRPLVLGMQARPPPGTPRSLKHGAYS